MAVSYAAGAASGAGQNATISAFNFTIPAAAQPGDVAVVAFGINKQSETMTPPAGWTVTSGPDLVGTTQSTWLCQKVLGSGDPGAAISFTVSTAGRGTGTMTVIRGGTVTGLAFTSTAYTSGSTSQVMPTLASVPAGAMFQQMCVMGNGATTTPTFTTPSTYTADPNNQAGTAYTTSSPNSECATFYKIISTAGSYGGETLTTSGNVTGTIYAVSIPVATGATGSLSLSGAGTVSLVAQSMTVSQTVAYSGNGAANLSGSPAIGGAFLATSGSGAAALSGTPAISSTLGTSGSGSVAAQPIVGGSIAYTGSGQLALTPSGTSLWAFAGPVTYEYAPFQPFTASWSRLVFEIAYGQTVWRDSTGAWQQQYAPSADQLTGATAIYAGGRTYFLTDQQLADLQAGGFSQYIFLEAMP